MSGSSSTKLARLEQRINRIEQENEELKTRLDQQKRSSSFTRRATLGAILGGGTLISAASQPAAAASTYWDDTDGDGDVELQAGGADFEDKSAYDISDINKDIEFVHAGRSVQDAITSAGNAGLIIIEENYDESVESWPITVDGKLTIMSTGNAQISNPSSNPAFEVSLGGNRPPGPRFFNLRVENGGPAFVIKDARYGIFRSCQVDSAEAGIQVKGTTGSDAVAWRAFGCDIESCSSNGILVQNSQHGFKLYDCQLIGNGGYGMYVGNAVNCGMWGGGVQLNSNEGIKTDPAPSFQAYGVYFEDNDSSNSKDFALASGEAVTIDSCWFQGSGNNNYAVAAASPTECSITNCDINNYGGAAMILNGGQDNEVGRPTHHLANVPAFIQDFGTRTRNLGTIREQSLNNVSGLYEGDVGIDDGSNTAGSGLPCVWTGSAWQPSDGSGTFT